MDLGITDRVAIVAGGSRGCGRAFLTGKVICLDGGYTKSLFQW